MDFKKSKQNSIDSPALAPPPPSESHVLLDFSRAIVASCCTIITSHPLDTVKTRIQASVQQNTAKSGISIFRSMCAQEGVLSLFRGVRFPLLGRGPCHALIMTGKEFAQRGILAHNPDASKLQQGVLSGIFGALCGMPVLIPQELLKCQAQNHYGRTFSYMELCETIWRQQGVRGLYRGACMTMLRDLPGFAIYFSVYENATEAFRPYRRGFFSSFFLVMLAGSMSGMVSWSTIYPIDIVKTQVQTQPI